MYSGFSNLCLFDYSSLWGIVCVFSSLHPQTSSPLSVHLNVILDGCAVLGCDHCSKVVQGGFIFFLLLSFSSHARRSHNSGRPQEHLAFLPVCEDNSSSHVVPIFSPLLFSPGVRCRFLTHCHKQQAPILWTPLSVEQPLFPQSINWFVSVLSGSKLWNNTGRAL